VGSFLLTGASMLYDPADYAVEVREALKMSARSLALYTGIVMPLTDADIESGGEPIAAGAGLL
jgi:hypothetical protein